MTDATCTCGHPQEYHTGPYSSCGAINCRCDYYAPPEDRAPESDEVTDDSPPKMEFRARPRVGFREMC